MQRFEEQLRSYKEFHRHPKNELTHYFGIPTVVFSIFLLMSALRFPLGERSLSAAWILLILSSLYYLMLNFPIGAVITLFSTTCVISGQLLYESNPSAFWWLTATTMILGWGLQFLGHYYEGKRPAFFKNLIHLLNGPLFVAHELVALLRKH